MAQATLIGWQEYCALSALGLHKIRAKIDTGARTSALHATHIKFTEIKGEPYVYFSVGHTKCQAKLVEMRMVTNSGGQQEKRPVIETTIAMGGYQFNIEITLTNRTPMRFPMLLGRQALKHRFYIDPNKRYLLGKL